jgi:hypothetical protein
MMPYIGYEDDEDDNRVYNEEERDLINSFKDSYMAARTPTERRMITQTNILPKLFNYWKDRGKKYNKRDTKTKTNVR